MDCLYIQAKRAGKLLTSHLITCWPLKRSEAAQGKWFSHTMHKMKLLTKVVCPDKTVNIFNDRDVWQQNKQTNDVFSVASYNHRSSPFMVIKLKLLFPETILSTAKVDLLNDVQ